MEADLSWLIDIVRALGVGGGPLFAVLWWLERKERHACQAAREQLQREMFTTTNQNANGMSAVKDTQVELRLAIKEGFAAVLQAIRSKRT